MANPEHLSILKQGVRNWNRWWKGQLARYPITEQGLSEEVGPEESVANFQVHVHHVKRADLGGADLTDTDLRGIDFSGTLLSKVRLVKADLASANMAGARLFGVNLGEANLQGADLTSAHVIGSSFKDANLSQACLLRAHLLEVDLSYCDLAGTNFTLAGLVRLQLNDVDLSRAIGLETAKHGGPSSIGIDTIYRSKGNIPDVFLRGAGVPEDFIVYMRSLVRNPIEFYSCFISYSTKDQEFADRLYAGLQGKGVRCWFAPHDARSGRKLHEQIDRAIRFHDKLLLILSPDSMKSEWVKTEISKARKREVQEGRQVLFPVRLCSFEALREWEGFDGDTGRDLAREIREYFIPDFSHWKNYDSYMEQFGRLLRDLKAGKTSGKTEKQP
ncbi:MAG TPA: toll/interleukin-1 receptor domain-containing protein [Terriglobia bacterium]|nr:toll/interleukin-1 receptor domain-containing protein [Terriglobia bacterium]